MWCMLAAPLILGNDLTSISEEILNIISNEDVIAINQDPLGRQAYRFVTFDGIDVWAKSLSDGKYAVAILNKNKNESKVFFDWKMRGKCFFADEGDVSDYNIYNVWDKKKTGTTANPVETNLDGRDVLLLMMTKTE